MTVQEAEDKALLDMLDNINPVFRPRLIQAMQQGHELLERHRLQLTSAMDSVVWDAAYAAMRTAIISYDLSSVFPNAKHLVGTWIRLKKTLDMPAYLKERYNYELQ